MLRIVLCVVMGLAATVGQAADFRVAAETGAVRTLLKSGQVAGGDTVILEAGRHGILDLSSLKFDKPVTITTDPARPALVDQLKIQQSAQFTVRNLIVRPPSGKAQDSWLVMIRDSAEIVLDGLTIASDTDATGWTVARWRKDVRDGIRIERGRDITIKNNRLKYVRHAITTRAIRSRVENNLIEWFAGDGIRGLSDDSVYIGNTIDTCVDIDDNHDDGFQSWSTDAKGKVGLGVVRNVRFENNVIRNGSGPLVCKLQGVGMFDGFFEDWIIRGNTIIVNHWHGITVMGGRRVRIIENTVVDSDPRPLGPPWITITAHKNGTVSQDSLIARNVTQPWRGGTSKYKQPQPGVRNVDNRVGVTAHLALQMGQ